MCSRHALGRSGQDDEVGIAGDESGTEADADADDGDDAAITPSPSLRPPGGRDLKLGLMDVRPRTATRH